MAAIHLDLSMLTLDVLRDYANFIGYFERRLLLKYSYTISSITNETMYFYHH